jgi:hypothetical protein
VVPNMKSVPLMFTAFFSLLGKTGSVGKRTFRRDRVTIVTWKSNILSVCLYCYLSYPARKSHFSAQQYVYIVICGFCGSTKFFTLSHKRQDFRGKSY